MKVTVCPTQAPQTLARECLEPIQRLASTYWHPTTCPNSAAVVFGLGNFAGSVAEGIAGDTAVDTGPCCCTAEMPTDLMPSALAVVGTWLVVAFEKWRAELLGC